MNTVQLPLQTISHCFPVQIFVKIFQPQQNPLVTDSYSVRTSYYKEGKSQKELEITVNKQQNYRALLPTEASG